MDGRIDDDGGGGDDDDGRRARRAERKGEETRRDETRRDETSAADATRRVARAHEVGDDAMERAPFVGQRLARSPDALLARAQRAKILARPRHDVDAELEDDPPRGGATDAHVEETSRQRRHREGRTRLSRARSKTRGARGCPRAGLVPRSRHRERERRAGRKGHRFHRQCPIVASCGEVSETDSNAFDRCL